MKETLKKYIPQIIWDSARFAWVGLVHVVDHIGPSLRKKTYCGYTLLYNSGNSIIKRLKSEAIFEEKMSKAIVNDLRRFSSSFFLDIGANIGFISLYVAREVPQAKIYAFEPGPRQASLLEKTIEVNGLKLRIMPSRVALSDSIGTQTFYTHPMRDMAKDGFEDTGRGEKAQQIRVETITLDTWWKKNGKPKIGVVKIDTEGAELLVLRGAKDLLAEVKPIIYLEIEERNLKAYPYKVIDVLNHLNAAGYRLETLDGERAGANNLNALISDHDTFRAVSN
jgi:FkbM family methyltransferase